MLMGLIVEERQNMSAITVDDPCAADMVAVNGVGIRLLLVGLLHTIAHHVIIFME